MRTHAVLVVFAIILIVGGCQHKGTNNVSNKEFLINDPIQDQKIAFSGLRLGTYEGGVISRRRLSLDNGYDQAVLARGFEDEYIHAYGLQLESLPLGTMMYGGDESSSYFEIFQSNSTNLPSNAVQPYFVVGYVEIEVNFTEGRIIRFDATALRPQTAFGLEPEKIIELRNSNKITVDPSTGEFGGTSTLSVTRIRGTDLESEFVNGSPYELTVKGHFHGDSENSALSGVFYTENAQGGLIAKCTTCE